MSLLMEMYASRAARKETMASSKKCHRETDHMQRKRQGDLWIFEGFSGIWNLHFIFDLLHPASSSISSFRLPDRGEEPLLPGGFPPSWPSPHPFLQWGPTKGLFMCMLVRRASLIPGGSPRSPLYPEAYLL